MAQTTDSREVHLACDVQCPHCDTGPHHVELVAEVTRGTLLFGGPGVETATPTQVSLVCPVTGEPIETVVRVPLMDQERVRAVRVAGGSAASPATQATVQAADRAEAAPTDPASATIAEWRNDSAAIGRDAAGKFLAAGTAAVAAYFPLLRYVGGESVAGWRLAVAVVPAVGYLAVTVLSAVVLRPLLARVYTPDEFETFLDRVLHRQRRLLTAVVVTFVTSTILAAAALLVVWR